VLPDTSHVLDALDADGRAWWLIVGNPDAPEDWTELLPLPGDEPVSAYTLEPPADGEVAQLCVWLRANSSGIYRPCRRPTGSGSAAKQMSAHTSKNYLFAIADEVKLHTIATELENHQ
jgi:hypothetical protein